jgi:hypothetical protein
VTAGFPVPGTLAVGDQNGNVYLWRISRLSS